MTIGIYMIKNKINNKMYIGKSKNIEYRFYNGHRKFLIKNNHANKHLQRSWNKYGEENFEFSIIEKCKEDCLNEREIYWINYYNSSNMEYGYNKTLGGDGGTFNEEIRKKMSISRKGRIPWNKGIPLSDEHKLKLSILGSGEGNPFYGKQHTIETKQKISNSRKNKGTGPRYEDVKNKISETQKLKWQYEQFRNKHVISFSMEQMSDILCKRKLGFSYQKIAKIYNVSYSTIRRMCLENGGSF